MASIKTAACLFLGLALCLAQPQPPSKAPDQGYVPAGWAPHEGGLLKYRVAIRFGEEPDTMPDGWKFGRVSAATTDSKGDVYVFHRGPKADAVVVFDSKGKYLRSWGKGSSAIRTACARTRTTTSGRSTTATIRSTSSPARADFSRHGAPRTDRHR
jgi:hypothetical protein